MNMAHAYENIDVLQLKSWMKKPGNIMFAMPFKDTSHNIGTNRKTADAIGNALKEIFNLPSISVTPALPQRAPTSINAAPYTYLISDIPSWVGRSLDERQCVASIDIQFLVFPKRWLGPSYQYIGTLQNLVSTNLANITNRGKEMFTSDLARIFIAHPKLNAAFRELIRDRQEDHQEDQDMDFDYDLAIQELLAKQLSIRVLDTEETGKVPSASVNMYLNTGLNSDACRVNIVSILKTMTAFGMYDYGTGTYLAGWKCPSCRGIDHPTGMCPFYDVPLWKEITKTTPTSKLRGHGTQISNTDHAHAQPNPSYSQATNAQIPRGRGWGAAPPRRPQRPRGGRGDGSGSYRGGAYQRGQN